MRTNSFHLAQRHFRTTALSKSILLSILTSAVSFGAVIFDSGVTTLSAALSVQDGRLARSTVGNGIPSDWSTPVTFPGAVNPTVPYGYEAFSIPASPYSYLQISFYDVLGAANTFASAYENAYLPTGTGPNLGLDTNYLGYEGNSGNLAGNPRAFQVILPNPGTNHLIVVVNDTSTAGGGSKQPFEFLVEGFYDTNFDDTSTVPEPGSLFLAGLGMGTAVLFSLLRRRQTR